MSGTAAEKKWACENNRNDSVPSLINYLVTVQQVCALAALTVRKHNLEGKNPIGTADLE